MEEPAMTVTKETGQEPPLKHLCREVERRLQGNARMRYANANLR
jgi:hypothetical protein